MAPAPSDQPSREELAGALRAARRRVTPVRLAAAAALGRRPHADTETVTRHVLDDIGTVSQQSVYNALACLVDAGLARRIEPAGSVALYELRVGDNHHHVVCRRCGSVTDVDCAVGRRPCLTPSQTHGYLLDEAEVTFWGLCPACRAAGGPPRPQGTGSPGQRGSAPNARAARRDGTIDRDEAGKAGTTGGPR